MSEQTIAPCPKCGEPGVSEDYLFVGCSDIDCTLPEMMMQDWSRLSRAAALLRAVEGLDTNYAKIRPSEIPGEWIASARSDAGIHTYALGPSPVDALIALAAQLEARDAK